MKALFLAFEQLPSYACGGQGEKEGGEGEEGWSGREREKKETNLLGSQPLSYDLI